MRKDPLPNQADDTADEDAGAHQERVSARSGRCSRLGVYSRNFPCAARPDLLQGLTRNQGSILAGTRIHLLGFRLSICVSRRQPLPSSLVTFRCDWIAVGVGGILHLLSEIVVLHFGKERLITYTKILGGFAFVSVIHNQGFLNFSSLH